MPIGGGARIEAKWIDGFCEVLRLCGVVPGEASAVPSETHSRLVLVDLAALAVAVARLGARCLHVTVRLDGETVVCEGVPG